MMQTSVRSKFLLGAFLVMSTLFVGASAQAAQADIDLLQSYVGNWRGQGVTNAAGGDETIACRMDISESEIAKVKYVGVCALAGGKVSIRGTMAFVKEANRFEAIMSSSTAFQGVAIGKRRGKNISFNLRDRNPETGAEFAIDADMALKSGNIEVVFTITEVATKKKIVAKVPFKK